MRGYAEPPSEGRVQEKRGGKIGIDQMRISGTWERVAGGRNLCYAERRLTISRTHVQYGLAGSEGGCTNGA